VITKGEAVADEVMVPAPSTAPSALSSAVGDSGPLPRVGEDAGVANLTSLYSQLCGVLAGFAFAGLAIYLNASQLPAQAAAVSVSLFTAFAALVIVSVLYALLSGESSRVATRRTDTSLLLYGLPFGLSIITMFYALTLMAVERPELAGMVGVGKFLVVVATPTILLGRLNIAAIDIAADHGRWKPHQLGWVLLILYPIVAAFILNWSSLTAYVDATAGSVPGYIGLGSAVLAAVVSPIISTRPPGYRLRPGWVASYLTLSFVAVVTYSVLAVAALA